MPREKRRKKTTSTARPGGTHSRAIKRGERTQRRRKISSRAGSGGHTAGTLGTFREEPPLLRLLETLEEEKIRYIVIGMAAAVTQGVMANTLDVDLWIDLPPRQYIRLLNLTRRLGATVAANTVVYLTDGTPVNFVYQVTGLETFSREMRRVTRTPIHGHTSPVLSLQRILKSKEAIGRDKDRLHILLIRDFLRCRREIRSQRRRS